MKAHIIHFFSFPLPPYPNPKVEFLCLARAPGRVWTKTRCIRTRKSPTTSRCAIAFVPAALSPNASDFFLTRRLGSSTLLFTRESE